MKKKVGTLHFGSFLTLLRLLYILQQQHILSDMLHMLQTHTHTHIINTYFIKSHKKYINILHQPCLWSTQAYKNIGLVLLCFLYQRSVALLVRVLYTTYVFLLIFLEKKNVCKQSILEIISNPCILALDAHALTMHTSSTRTSKLKKYAFLYYFFSIVFPYIHKIYKMYLNLVYEHFHESSYIPCCCFRHNFINVYVCRNKVILLYFDSSVLLKTTKPFF